MLMGPGLLMPSTLIDRVEQEPAGVHVFDAAAGVIVFAATTASNPGTIWVRDARGTRQIADLHPWLEQKDLSIPESRWIERPDGVRVQYWLMPPTNRRAGAAYPAVLQIHGGPTWMWGPGERTMWHEFQLLCSWGYAVVYANPRGSSGYGEEFQSAIQQDWSAGPSGDVLAALDHALLEPWIDEERLAVTGGSYGGYLTAAILTRDQRFRAAVAQRGVYDLNTFFGEGSAFDMVEPHFGGFPWEARSRPVFQRESPFSAVQRIRTPLLIMHADQDLTTGVSQSAMLYRALKQLGRPVEYVRYPDADHNLSRTGDPVLRLDRLARTIEFFERFIENPRPAPRRRARIGGDRAAPMVENGPSDSEEDGGSTIGDPDKNLPDA
jgi:dipeptidyl aminopeptidase/acylaminoacyl peptidase